MQLIDLNLCKLSCSLLDGALFGHEFNSRHLHHIIETIGLILKVSVLFSFYRAISLILGINRLIFGEVALFSLPVLKAGNLSKARTDYQKHEYTLISVNRPLGKDA